MTMFMCQICLNKLIQRPLMRISILNYTNDCRMRQTLHLKLLCVATDNTDTTLLQSNSQHVKKHEGQDMQGTNKM